MYRLVLIVQQQLQHCQTLFQTLHKTLDVVLFIINQGVSDTCDLIFWDPVACVCTCRGASCGEYKDKPRVTVTGSNPQSTGSGPGNQNSSSSISGSITSALLFLLQFFM